MKIDFNKINWSIEKAITDWINQATEYLLVKVKEKSPEDTKEYIKWHKIEKANNYWNRIKGAVYNDMEYAQEVEFWFRSTPVNWYKNRKWWWPKIYTWIGARPYTQVADIYEKDIINIIKKNIKI